MLNDQNYGDQFNITADKSICPKAATPQYCPNEGTRPSKCAADYKGCGIPELDCPTDLKPIKCKKDT